MILGFPNTLPIPEVDFTAPRQVDQEAYPSQHILSEGGFVALAEMRPKVPQADIQAHLFELNSTTLNTAQSQVNQAHGLLRTVLGNNSAGVKLDERHALLAPASTKARVVTNKQKMIQATGSWVKYLAPKGLGLFMLAQTSGVFSLKLGSASRDDPNVGFFGLNLNLTTAPFQNLPFAFCVSWFGGELLLKAHDWLNPKYLSGIDRSLKEISGLAEDFRKVGLDGSNARRGGEAAANSRDAYGEHGRDFLEGLMNEVDLSAYNYLLALTRQQGAVVGAAALQLVGSRVEEARFVNTFTGRTKAEQAIVRDWTPSVAYEVLGQKKRVAIDPLGANRQVLNRARGDFSEPVGAATLWDYSRKLEEAVVYVEAKAKEVFSLDKSPERVQLWREVKADLAAMGQTYDPPAMFRLGVLMEKGVLGIPAGIEAVALAKQLYLPAALMNDKEAQYRLGVLYSKSHGFGFQGQKDDKRATDWLTKAANQDHAEALGLLGVMHAQERTGLDRRSALLAAHDCCEQAVQAGVRNPELLFTWAELFKGKPHDAKLIESYYEQAAEGGHAGAKREIGLIRLTQGDADSAARYLKDVSLHNDPLALHYLGELYFKPIGGQQANLPLAAEYFSKAIALGGLRESHFKLGLMLYESDADKAAYHFEKASTAGHAQAKCHLASMYADCLVDPPNGMSSVKAAASLYEEAIALGSNMARLSFSKMLMEDNTLPKAVAHQKIVYLLTQAANQPKADPRVFFKLGMLYVERAEGLPVGKQGNALALKWLDKAALAGLPEAKYHLALLHLSGRTPVQSKAEMQEKAAELLTPLAEGGNPDAKFHLGVLCLNAEVDEEGDEDKDERVVMGVELLNQAAGLGHVGAKVELFWLLLKQGVDSKATQDKLGEMLGAVAEKDKAEVYSALLQRTFDAKLPLNPSLALWADCVKPLEHAANNDHAPSLRVLAILQLRGVMNKLPASKAAELAMKNLQRAAELDDVPAMLLLGMMNEKKRNPLLSVQDGLKAAFALYERAARMGSAQALFRQGALIENGAIEVAEEESRLEKAAALYLQAAEGGDQDGMLATARLLKKGVGVLPEGETHEGLAEHWLTEAADKGA